MLQCHLRLWREFYEQIHIWCIQIMLSFGKCISLVVMFGDSLINNFKMKGAKTQEQKQREKLKNQLIFKYVKSFHNPQAEIYLEKLRNGTKEKKESILLNSKVFQVSVMSASHKKRVSFAQNDVIHERKPLSKKQKNKNVKDDDKVLEKSNNDMQGQQFSSPERVKSDLMELQRSIFTKFKIKHEEKPFHHEYSSLGPRLSQKNESERAYYSQGAYKQTSHIPEGKVARAKSCSTISQIGLQSTLKQTEAESMQSRTLKSSGLTRSLSQSSPPLISKKSSQLSNPSSIYSQQSHNLMVQIFKQKLQNKRIL